ncbi:MAG: hypothetical protein ACRC68_13945, partial [Clostridium sp.]
TTKRYFGTEHGSEIEMTPSALNIKGGSKEPLSISFDDEIGVTIKSPKNLSLNADDEIIIKTPQSVKLKAQSQILMVKTGTESGFSMETDMHFLSNNVINNGSDREAYAAFEDEPKVGKKPERKEKSKDKKKGFNWGKLAKNVLAGLAVVAVVVVAAAAIAVTAGAATGVVAAIAISAGVAGTAAVASQAVSDIVSGEVSDMSTYMIAGAREAFIGAISGAIFGPLGAMKTLGGKMLFGGVTNGFESIIRQTLEGKGINLKTLLLDAGIGSLTAGLFHGAGKLFAKASPFVKNAFNKVSSQISDNMKAMKTAFNNMKMPKGVRLGSGLGGGDSKIGKEFLEEFKKAKDDITKGVNKTVDGGKNKKITGETSSTKIGKQVHKVKADARRKSGDYDTVNEALKDKDGNVIEVPKRIDKQGRPSKKYQRAIPDAVQGPPKGNIIDDKPLGRPISKDKQEIRRFIDAYKQKYGEAPKNIIIEIYDPKTGLSVGREIYHPD